MFLLCLVLWLLLHSCLHCNTAASNRKSRKRVPENWNGSAVGTENYKMEVAVINQAKADYAKVTLGTRKGLLCATFVGANESASEILLINLKVMSGKCDWAIILYSGTQAAVDRVCEDERIASVAVHCQRSPASFGDHMMQSHNGRTPVKLSIPKTVLYQELMPYVRHYKQVFLLDEDISLEGFNITSFQQHWDCAFPHKPLIVQPLIFESNQFITFMNLKSWSADHRSKIVASAVGLVEQQVPLMDAVFFEWFVKRVLSFTRETALQHGVDWGHDRSWCNAAAMYSRAVLQYPNDSVPCAVFPTAPPVHHLNLKSMASKRENRSRFHANGVKVVQLYIDLFPTWVITDLLAPNNPLDPRNKHKFPRATELDQQCLARRNRGG